jgi:predicted DNA-binding protein
MTRLKVILTEQLTTIQGQLSILNGVPEDTFNIGTVVVFASGLSGAVKWYYVKMAEEVWMRLNGSSSGTGKPLNEWALDAVEAHIGYFEVYELKVQPTPIYSHS